jgi:hypothetical protein
VREWGLITEGRSYVFFFMKFGRKDKVTFYKFYCITFANEPFYVSGIYLTKLSSLPYKQSDMHENISFTLP